MNNDGVAVVDQPTEQEIRSQLERILKSPPFRSSKRHPRFLRFIIEKTLSGTAQEIKERIIGVEVFDRDVHYDVASDPIVRVAAGEIRKRLAQYYIQPGHERELRIELPSGSYIPLFHLPPSAEDTPTANIAQPELGLAVLSPLKEAPATPEPRVSAVDSAAYEPRSVKSRRTWVAVVLAVAVLILAMGGEYVWLRKHPPSTDLDVFWRPLLNEGSGPILCIGDLNYLIEDQSPTLPRDVNRIFAAHDHITGKDALALARIEGFLGENDRYGSVMLSDNTTLTDLRSQPAVVIGAFNNRWTEELLSGYRFQFSRDQAHETGAIRDTRKATPASWAIDIGSPPAAVHKDYALVSRIKSPITEQTELFIAGIGPSGTVAASEFVTNPHYFREFVKLAPPGWQNHDVQIVISTDVIGERSAPPHLIAFDVH